MTRPKPIWSLNVSHLIVRNPWSAPQRHKTTKKSFAKRVKKVIARTCETKCRPISWNKVEIFHDVFSSTQILHLNGTGVMPAPGIPQVQRNGDVINTTGYKMHLLIGQKGDHPNVNFRWFTGPERTRYYIWWFISPYHCKRYVGWDHYRSLKAYRSRVVSPEYGRNRWNRWRWIYVYQTFLDSTRIYVYQTFLDSTRGRISLVPRTTRLITINTICTFRYCVMMVMVRLLPTTLCIISVSRNFSTRPNPWSSDGDSGGTVSVVGAPIIITPVPLESGPSDISWGQLSPVLTDNL
jgi:hypothetical protein